MNARRHGWTVMFLFAFALFPAVLQAASVTSVILCREVQEPGLIPIDIQDSFPTTTPVIHAVVAVADVTRTMQIGAAWIAVNAIATPNYRIDATELEVAAGHGTQAHFSLSKPDNDWPPGDYRLEVFLDGQLATIKNFTIVAASGRTAPESTAPPPAPGAVPPSSTGQGYGGTYRYEVQGTRVTLVLAEDPQGGLTGTLSSTSGMAFQLEGQVEGGVAMGLGYGLTEELQVVEGRVQNPDFRDYKLLTAPEMPEVEMHFIETNAPEGPFGAKGIGEAPAICVAPALANAVYDATGIRFRRLPLTPERVLLSLRTGREILPEEMT